MSFSYLIRFSKHGKTRFLSHLDTMKVWTRLLRCSGFKLAFSMGYTPRVKISFPLALATGIESDDEVIIVQLSEFVDSVIIAQRLNDLLPEEIKVLSCESFDKKACIIERVDYLIELDELSSNIKDMVDKILNQREIFFDREGKNVELKQFIDSIRLIDKGIFVCAKVLDGRTIRPKEIVELLALSQGKLRKLKTYLK